MYTVTNDTGNIYITDSDGNNISFKDSDVMNTIFSNSLILQGDSDDVTPIVQYVQQKKTEVTEVYIPSYLSDSAVSLTALAPEDI